MDHLRSDGKRPDGVTLVPWTSGWLLISDATRVDTFAESYRAFAESCRAFATQKPGMVAAEAEARKSEKYQGLPAGQMNSPAAIETLGVFGPRTVGLLRELGRCIAAVSGEPRSTEYLFQCLSVAIQRGNCISVLGSIH